MIFVALIFSGVASCLMIDDSDLKDYCKARQSGTQSNCSVIKDEGLRTTCRVELGADVSLCNSIADSEQRAICQSYAKVKFAPN